MIATYLLCVLLALIFIVLISYSRTIGGKSNNKYVYKKRWISPSIYTIGDAYCTYKIHFAEGDITFDDFMDYVYRAKYRMKTVEEISKYDNVSLKRLKHDTATKAYPPSNRPRGRKDIESVKYHLQTDIIEPIIVLHVDGKTIMLDGMHRLVAANILDIKVKCMFISVCPRG